MSNNKFTTFNLSEELKQQLAFKDDFGSMVTRMERAESKNLEQELHKIVTQLQTALKPQHELATKNTQEPEETNKTDNKRGRKKKYTPELLQSMQNTFDEHIKKLDTKGAWNKVADIFGIPSGKAAEMACKRAKK